jgi:hypothetical protein
VSDDETVETSNEADTTVDRRVAWPLFTMVEDL